ncbi:MAG: UDP-N-acetylmuramate--L-alanine ligase [Candidatus Edwardsbacteria bacterium]
MFKHIKRIYFVGIGGIGMSGIAEILINLGYQVSGSDLKLTEITDRLQKLGAKIFEGHRKENLGNVDVVVISSAVKEDNPEVIAAKEQKIPIIRRAEMLAELMRMKYGVAVAGTHGKTTTTSMIGLVLTKGALEPTVIVGGVVRNFGSNAQIGTGEFLVTEADEFDRSFLKLTPTIAVVTTIEAEHLDCYRDFAEIKHTFVEFVNKVPFYGVTVLCLDEKGVQEIIPRIEKRYVTYGLSSQAELQARNIKFKGIETEYIAYNSRGELGKIELKVPGVHNVKNSLAALATGLELGIPLEKIKTALSEFSGVYRRFEIKGEIKGIKVIDDYAHHPTEIEATLKAAKDSFDCRVVAVFQPHLYSRTRDFFREFGSAFYQADILIIADVYPAREEPIPGVSGELIAQAAREFGHRDVTYLSEKDQIAPYLKNVAKKGDLVITLGAGDIWKVGEEFLRKS